MKRKDVCWNHTRYMNNFTLSFSLLKEDVTDFNLLQLKRANLIICKKICKNMHALNVEHKRWNINGLLKFCLCGLNFKLVRRPHHYPFNFFFQVCLLFSFCFVLMFLFLFEGDCFFVCLGFFVMIILTSCWHSFKYSHQSKYAKNYTY